MSARNQCQEETCITKCPNSADLATVKFIPHTVVYDVAGRRPRRPATLPSVHCNQPRRRTYCATAESLSFCCAQAVCVYECVCVYVCALLLLLLLLLTIPSPRSSSFI